MHSFLKGSKRLTVTYWHLDMWAQIFSHVFNQRKFAPVNFTYPIFGVFKFFRFMMCLLIKYITSDKILY